MTAALDVNLRVVTIGDEIRIDDGTWHRITSIEPNLTLHSKDGPRSLCVVVLANGAAWNVASRETRESA